jgi:uncharacterized membrane protein
LAIVAALLAAIFGFLFTKAGSIEQSLLLMVPALFFGALPFGCGTSTLPLVAPNRLRAQVVAVYLLVANLLGNTIGPTGVGAFTDFIYKDELRLGDAISTVAPILYILGAAIACLAIRPYSQVMGRDLTSG